jgi:hypothetical protein
MSSDCIAFTKIYQDLNLENDTLTETNCCEWDPFRVQCLQGRIHILNLQELPTQGGILSPWFMELTALRGLNLSNSQLVGSIPPTWSNKSFYFLNLRDNRLNGTLPALQMEQHNLTFLDLRGNAFQGAIPSSLLRGVQQAPRPRNGSYCPFDSWLCVDREVPYCDRFTCSGVPQEVVSTQDESGVSLQSFLQSNEGSSPNFLFPTLISVGVVSLILSILLTWLMIQRRSSRSTPTWTR